jgi:hypothetical protein
VAAPRIDEGAHPEVLKAKEKKKKKNYISIV